MKFAKLDDYTFKITWPQPYGTFLYVLAQWQGRYVCHVSEAFLDAVPQEI